MTTVSDANIIKQNGSICVGAEKNITKNIKTLCVTCEKKKQI